VTAIPSSPFLFTAAKIRFTISNVGVGQAVASRQWVCRSIFKWIPLKKVKQKVKQNRKLAGAGEGIRTLDNLLGSYLWGFS